MKTSVAAFLASFSDYAYKTPEQIAALMPPSWEFDSQPGADFIQSSDVGNSGDVQAFFSYYAAKYNHKSAVLAFRGSEPSSLEDWKSNLNNLNLAYFDPSLHEHGQVHRGFLAAWNSVKRRVFDRLDWIRKNKTENYERINLYITGHSQGGALAVLATIAILEYVRSQSVYNLGIYLCSFAAPTVGDTSFVNYYKSLLAEPPGILSFTKAIHFYNSYDFVTRTADALDYNFPTLPDRIDIDILRLGSSGHAISLYIEFLADLNNTKRFKDSYFAEDTEVFGLPLAPEEPVETLQLSLAVNNLAPTDSFDFKIDHVKSQKFNEVTFKLDDSFKDLPEHFSGSKNIFCNLDSNDLKRQKIVVADLQHVTVERNLGFMSRLLLGFYDKPVQLNRIDIFINKKPFYTQQCRATLAISGNNLTWERFPIQVPYYLIVGSTRVYSDIESVNSAPLSSFHYGDTKSSKDEKIIEGYTRTEEIYPRVDLPQAYIKAYVNLKLASDVKADAEVLTGFKTVKTDPLNPPHSYDHETLVSETGDTSGKKVLISEVYGDAARYGKENLLITYGFFKKMVEPERLNGLAILGISSTVKDKISGTTLKADEQGYVDTSSSALHLPIVEEVPADHYYSDNGVNYFMPVKFSSFFQGRHHDGSYRPRLKPLNKPAFLPIKATLFNFGISPSSSLVKETSALEANNPANIANLPRYSKEQYSKRIWVPLLERTPLYEFLDQNVTPFLIDQGINILLPDSKYENNSSKTGWQLFQWENKTEYMAVLQLQDAMQTKQVCDMINLSNTLLSAKNGKSGNNDCVIILCEPGKELQTELEKILSSRLNPQKQANFSLNANTL